MGSAWPVNFHLRSRTKEGPPRCLPTLTFFIYAGPTRKRTDEEGIGLRVHRVEADGSVLLSVASR